MQQTLDPIPGITDDPIFQILLRGEAQTLHDAEELYLDKMILNFFDC